MIEYISEELENGENKQDDDEEENVNMKINEDGEYYFTDSEEESDT